MKKLIAVGIVLVAAGLAFSAPAADTVTIPLTQEWTLFATGSVNSVAWSGLLVRDGGGVTRTLTQAETAGWIDSKLYYFDLDQTYHSTPADDANLWWYRGYWIWSHVPGLTLLIVQ